RRLEGLAGRDQARPVDGSPSEDGAMKTLNPPQTPLLAGKRERERGEQRSNSPAVHGWRLPLLVGLALAVITAVPYAYAYATQPPGHVFVGFFYLWDDATTYIAKMREGWEGAWAWQNRYTTESSGTAYLFLFWIGLGHLSALTGLPLIIVFHLARVAGAFALMAAGWLFITHFIEDRSARRFALLFLAF